MISLMIFEGIWKTSLTVKQFLSAMYNNYKNVCIGIIFEKFSENLWNVTSDFSSVNFSGHYQAATGRAEEHRRGWEPLHFLHWLAQLHSEKLHSVNWQFWGSGPGRHGEEDEKTRGIDLFTLVCTVIYLCGVKMVLNFTVTVLNLHLSVRYLGTRCSVALNTPPWAGCDKSALTLGITIENWWVSKSSVCSGEFEHKLIWVQYPSQQKCPCAISFSAKQHTVPCTDFFGSYNMLGQ